MYIKSVIIKIIDFKISCLKNMKKYLTGEAKLDEDYKRWRKDVKKWAKNQERMGKERRGR